MTASGSMRSALAASIQCPCQGGDYTKDVFPRLRAAGWQGHWIDAASALRMEPDAVIVQRAVGLGLRGGGTARVGGGKENRLDEVEVALGDHAVHQDRADHAAPADEADPIANSAHCVCLLGDEGEKPVYVSSARTTASPISAVPTRVVPALWMSGVRRPSASTRCTAASMRVAASGCPSE